MFLGFNLKEAIDYAFLNKQTRKTLFLFIGIQLGIVALTILLVLPTLIPILGFFFICCLYVFLIVFPIILAFFESGARYEILESALNDKPIPDLTKNLKYTFKEGAKTLLVRILAGIVAFIPLFVVITIYVILLFIAMTAGIILLDNQSSFGVILFMILIVVIEYPLIYIISAVSGAIIEPAVYHYIRKGRKLGSIGEIEEIGKSISAHWKAFFKLALVTTLISLAQFIFLLPFIIILIIGTYGESIMISLLGFFLLLLAIVPIVIFNTGFNALSYPHLLSQIFKKNK